MKTTKNLVSLILLFVFIAGISINAFAQKGKNTKSDADTPIFEIKNDAGQTVFAVYPGGVKIFVEDQLKATGGGFTVGRIGTEKTTGEEILSVSPGNVNIYLDNETTKVTGGGFTVGRIGTEKADGDIENFLTVTPDSTRVYIDENSNAGFAVGQIGSVGLQNFLHLTPENYFIGHHSGELNTSGIYNLFLGYQSGAENTNGKQNVFMGYQAGSNNISGSYNTFIGTDAGLNNVSGTSNIAIGNAAGLKGAYADYTVMIGDSAGANNTFPYNIYIGNKAGLSSVDGRRNLFIGYMAGMDNISGGFNTYLGAFTGMNSLGEHNTYVGYWAGGTNLDSNNVFIGYRAGANSSGKANVFIGHQAGDYAQGDSMLYIANSYTSNPLIYGEFNNKLVRINGDLQYTGTLTHYSDKRLKKDISEINNALEKILKINGVYFYWKENKFSKEKQIGVIAQEVEPVFPELVQKNSNGYLSVDYTKFTPILIQALKEQQKQIEALKQKNEKLTQKVSEVDELRAELTELKKLVKEIAGIEKSDKTESAK